MILWQFWSGHRSFNNAKKGGNLVIWDLKILAFGIMGGYGSIQIMRASNSKRFDFWHLNGMLPGFPIYVIMFINIGWEFVPTNFM